jgi:hypothetical protein
MVRYRTIMNPPSMPHYHLTPQDAEHVRLLGIFGYVYAGLQCFFALLGGFYMCMGFVLVMDNQPMGWMFVAVGALISLWIIAMASLSFLTAKWLGQGKNWLFCMIVSGFHCASFPFGTALGVFTIFVLCRPSVKAWFAELRAAKTMP